MALHSKHENNPLKTETIHTGKRHSKYVSEMLFHDELMKLVFVLPVKFKTLIHFRGRVPVTERGDRIEG